MRAFKVLSLLAGLLAFRGIALALGTPGPVPPGYSTIPNYSGVNAGQQFRNDINNHLEGNTAIAPLIAPISFSQLSGITEVDGKLFYVYDASATTPCTGSGGGAWAQGTRGQWSCGASGGSGVTNPLTVPLNFNSQKGTNLGTDTATGDALSRNQSTMNSLAVPTANVPMGSKKFTGLAQGTASGDSVALAAASTLPQYNTSKFNIASPKYGAVEDGGTTDNTTPIQNALNDACTAAGAGNAGSPVVYVPSINPSSYYGTTKPLINNCPYAITLRGDNKDGSRIMVGGYTTPALVFEGSTYLAALGTISTTNLATGAGNAFNWQNDFYYDLKQINPRYAPNPLSGLSSFSTGFFFNFPTSCTSSNRYYVTSSAGSLSLTSSAGSIGIDGTGALDVYFKCGTPNTLTACLNTSVSGRVCQSGNITSNANQFAEFDYNGSNSYLYAGTPGSTVAQLATSAQTGTVVAQPEESWLLGCRAATQFVFGDVEAPPSCYRGTLDSFQVSNIARHAGSLFTAPTAKQAADSNNLVMLNGASFYDAFTLTDGIPAYAGTGYLYAHLAAALGGGNAASRSQIRDVGIWSSDGPGLIVNGALFGKAIRSGFFGSPAIMLTHTSYGWEFEDGSIDAPNNANVALQANQGSGILRVVHNDMESPGNFPFALSNGAASGSVVDNFIQAGGSMIAVLAVLQQGTPGGPLIWQNNGLDSENGAPNYYGILSGIGDYDFIGGNFQPGGSNPAFQIYPSLGSIGAIGAITFDTPFFNPVSTTNKAFSFGSATSYGRMAMPIKVINGSVLAGCCAKSPMSSVAAAAISNDMTQVSIEDTQTLSGVAPTVSSCGTSPSAVAGDKRKFTFVVGSGTITSCSLTFPTNDFANSPNCQFQDSTAGLTLKQSSLSNTGVTLGAPSGTSSIGGDTIVGLCASNG